MPDSVRIASALGLLRRLAQAGAYLARQEGPDGTLFFSVFLSGPCLRETAKVSEQQFASLLSQGWIAPDASGVRWYLAKNGAAALESRKTRRSAIPAARRAATNLPQINDRESPLAWLRRRRDKQGRPLLSAAQYDAGERLRADLWHAQMTPRVTADWSGQAASRRRHRAAPGAGSDFADSVLAARQRVDRALRAVGVEAAGLLIDVCGHLKGLEQIEREEGWPQRSAKFFLGHALTALARHYGLIRENEDALGQRLRHWGAADYRPSLAAPSASSTDRARS